MFLVFLLINLIPISPGPLPQWVLQLEGSWMMKKNNYRIYEHWHATGDSILIGSSYQVTEQGDSILIENLEIRYLKDTLYYIPTVADQNDGEPVLFKLSHGTKQLATFENPKHDFPNKIEYRFITNKEIKATVSGSYQGNIHSLEFNYKRVK